MIIKFIIVSYPSLSARKATREVAFFCWPERGMSPLESVIAQRLRSKNLALSAINPDYQSCAVSMSNYQKSCVISSTKLSCQHRRFGRMEIVRVRSNTGTLSIIMVR